MTPEGLMGAADIPQISRKPVTYEGRGIRT
jgi:hypothetical protein